MLLKYKDENGNWVTAPVVVTGDVLPESSFVISGDCYYRFSNNGWNWFIEQYGDRITTKDITVANSMFHGSDKITKVPFDLNLSSSRSYHDSSYIFENCDNLTQLPKLNNVIVYDARGMFRSCYNLRTIPQDFADTWDWSYLEKQNSSSNGK